MDGNNVTDPSSYDDGTVSCALSAGSGTYLVCTVDECGARFGFYGVGKMSETVLIIPGEIRDNTVGMYFVFNLVYTNSIA